MSDFQSVGNRRYEALRQRRRLLLILLGATILIGFGVTFLTMRTISDERAEIRHMSHNILEMRNLKQALLMTETGELGYLKTRDARFVTIFENGQNAIKPTLAVLDERLRDGLSDRQQALYARIRDLAESIASQYDARVSRMRQDRPFSAEPDLAIVQRHVSVAQLHSALTELERLENAKLIKFDAVTDAKEAWLFPLLSLILAVVLGGLLIGLWMINRISKTELEAAQAFALAESREQADLLAKELNHRVKNIFAVILAIVQMSARHKPESKPLIESISNRIRALLTAHEVSQGALDKPVATIGTLIETTLSPYRSEQNIAQLQGPEILLPAKAVTPIGLVLHELTTNAVKYGAWAHGGTIKVTWARSHDSLQVDWCETGVPDCTAPEREGFGTLLMTSAARQLSGSISREFGPDGCTVTILAPLEPTPAEEQAGAQP